MVSEPSTGYICGFEVYTGDASGQSQGNVQEVQDASKTSCTVPGLLDSVQLLDMVIMFILIIITIALTWLIYSTREKCMHVAQSGKIKSHSL